MAEFATDEMFDKTGYVSGKFFFSKDDSCHWYMIPVELRNRWKQLNTDEDGKGWDTFDSKAFEKEFGQYRTNGGISHIEFIPII